MQQTSQQTQYFMIVLHILSNRLMNVCVCVWVGVCMCAFEREKCDVCTETGMEDVKEDLRHHLHHPECCLTYYVLVGKCYQCDWCTG